jgi:MYXO-CTERM domain-containing protein
MSARTRTTALLITSLVLLSGCLVNIEGEMGNADFRMDGGEDGSVAGAWGTDRAVALGSVMTVRAMPDQEMDGPVLRSTNDEVIALGEVLAVAPDAVSTFEAVGTGRAAIELRRSADERLIDFFRLDIEEAASASLLRIRNAAFGGADELVAAEFAVVEGMPVSMPVRLDDSSGEALNHHNVAVASSSATEVLEASAGGEIVLLDANAIGTATLSLSVPEQPAASDFEVSVVAEEDVVSLELRQVEPLVCSDHKLWLIADLRTSEGLDVLGVEVDWELIGDDLGGVPGDTTITVEFDADAFAPFTVVATYGALETSFVLDEAIVCDRRRRGCSLAPARPSGGPAQFALLLLALLVIRRRQRN